MMSDAGLTDVMVDAVSHVTLDAIILAGGRGSRLGGVDKASLRIDGERLVDRAAAAARAHGAGRVVVVGPDHTRAPGSLVVREDPPFAGPLAAVVAALPHLGADWTLLLSCDLEHPDAVSALLKSQLAQLERVPDSATDPDADPATGAAAVPHDGWVLIDDDGYPQWLAGLYRTAALRRGVERLGDSAGRDDGVTAQVANLPLRALFRAGQLRLTEIPAPSAQTADIDRPEDLLRAGAVPDTGPDSSPATDTEGDSAP